MCITPNEFSGVAKKLLTTDLHLSFSSKKYQIWKLVFAPTSSGPKAVHPQFPSLVFIRNFYAM